MFIFKLVELRNQCFILGNIIIIIKISVSRNKFEVVKVIIYNLINVNLKSNKKRKYFNCCFFSHRVWNSQTIH